MEERKECYGIITSVHHAYGRVDYHAVVRMSNDHILCARYELASEDEARAWLESQPVVGAIYVEKVR